MVSTTNRDCVEMLNLVRYSQVPFGYVAVQVDRLGWVWSTKIVASVHFASRISVHPYLVQSLLTRHNVKLDAGQRLALLLLFHVTLTHGGRPAAIKKQPTAQPPLTEGPGQARTGRTARRQPHLSPVKYGVASPYLPQATNQYTPIN